MGVGVGRRRRLHLLLARASRWPGSPDAARIGGGAGGGRASAARRNVEEGEAESCVWFVCMSNGGGGCLSFSFSHMTASTHLTSVN